MSRLETSEIQQPLSELTNSKLDELEAFSSIASTNTHLLAQPSPAPGRFRVAIADHQTSGRGRHYRRWFSPPGSGLYLSISYTCAETPENLPGLTLALGVGVVHAMNKLGIDGISLKWPNDIVANDGKLGGILTEVQSGSSAGVTVVAGVGLNVDMPKRMESDWAQRAIDLTELLGEVPRRELLAGTIIDELFATFVRFEALGFEGFAADWQANDWLSGKEITVAIPDGQITGIASGVDTDGALLVDGQSGKTRVVSGSIIMAGPEGAGV